jgi:hypothetical protein
MKPGEFGNKAAGGSGGAKAMPGGACATGESGREFSINKGLRLAKPIF